MLKSCSFMACKIVIFETYKETLNVQSSYLNSPLTWKVVGVLKVDAVVIYFYSTKTVLIEFFSRKLHSTHLRLGTNHKLG